jgi:hypothetical protein
MGRLKVTPHSCASVARAALLCVIAIAGVACATDEPSGAPPVTPVVQPPGTQQPIMGAAGNAAPFVPGMTNVPGGTAGMGSVQQPPSQVPTNGMPCAVNDVIKSRCQTCHGASPIGGAPMSLVTQADFHKDHASKTTMPGVTKKVYEWVKIRMNDAAKPMPQTGLLQGAELTTVNSWLDKQAPLAGSGDVCQGSNGTGGTGATGMGGNGSTPGTTLENECKADGAFEPLVARDGETCYDFPVHNLSSPTDKTEFNIIPGESYNQFYYSIPWPAGSIATRFGANFDNLPALHHWLMFASHAGTNGQVSTNVLGTTIGEDAQLIGGWAVGGCAVEFGDDMGLQLPSTGTIMVQWHHYNNTPAMVTDGSKVQICTLPANGRPHVGGLTWLGTENIEVPGGQKGQAVGTCENDEQEDITIVAFWPHMHEIGVHMKSEVMKAGESSWTTVFDKPFQFNYQVHYMQKPQLVLKPGDQIRSTCSFMNTTPGHVSFGQSTKQEMCYQFAFSYPAGALDNGVISLIGASNTCWQFGE